MLCFSRLSRCTGRDGLETSFATVGSSEGLQGVANVVYSEGTVWDGKDERLICSFWISSCKCAFLLFNFLWVWSLQALLKALDWALVGAAFKCACKSGWIHKNGINNISLSCQLISLVCHICSTLWEFCPLFVRLMAISVNFSPFSVLLSPFFENQVLSLST